MDGGHIERATRRRVLRTAVGIGIVSGAGSTSGGAESASDGTEGEARVGVASMGGEPANFEVDRIETNAPVEGGRTLEIAVELVNRGSYFDTKALDVEIDGLLTDSVPVVLVGGGASTETFSVETTPEDVGEHLVTASTEDDDAEEPVSVLAPTSFDVSVRELPSSVAAGEEIVATVEVANTDDVEGVESIAFEVGEIGSDSAAVLLEGGDETTETLSVETTPEDVGEHVVTIFAGNAETTETVTVTAEADENRPADEDGDRSVEDGTDRPAEEDEDRSTGGDTQRPAGEDAGRSTDEDADTPADEDDDPPADEDADPPVTEGPDNDRMPGFGIGGAVAGLGGIVHLLSRRLPNGDGNDR